MTLLVIIRPEAERDLANAQRWYEAERAGLGIDFRTAVGHSIGLIAERLLMFPVVLRGVRRVLLPRFPFGLFYKPEKDRLLVLACIHMVRDPKLIRAVVRERK